MIAGLGVPGTVRRPVGTIAEDVLLVSHTNVKTLELSERDELTEVLVDGCLVAEALLGGAVSLGPDGRGFSTGPRAMTADLDPLVRRAADHVLAVQPGADTMYDDEKWIAEVTYPIQACDEVVDRLRAQGAIRPEERKKFGRKATMVDVTDPASLDRLDRRFRAVMLDGSTPDPETALTLLIVEPLGRVTELNRAEQKRWNERSEALFTSWSWKGDEGRPTEPVPGIDDSTRRMLGDFVVSLSTAYLMGIAADIFSALNRYHR